MSQVKYAIETFPVGAFQCNCSILSHPLKPGLWIVDPGDEAQFIIDRVRHFNRPIVSLWHTHAHLDHVGATKPLFEWAIDWNKNWSLGTPKIFLHEEDRWLYENIAIQSQMLGIPSFNVVPKFDRIKDRQKYEDFAGLSAIHTPGHTPGSCCLLADIHEDLSIESGFKKSSVEPTAPVLFSGDTLFRRSIGRTDLWGGDGKRILESIQKKLFTLDPLTVVIPGHGPISTIEEESDLNPFFEDG
jgi:hydroxyacylglutathione hydrolase